MKEITNPKLAQMINDTVDLRGVAIVTYPSIDSVEADFTYLNDLRVVEDSDACDIRMVPYVIAKGLEEGWAHITIDDQAPGNKYDYLNRLMEDYRPLRLEDLDHDTKKKKVLFRIEEEEEQE